MLRSIWRVLFHPGGPLALLSATGSHAVDAATQILLQVDPISRACGSRRPVLQSVRSCLKHILQTGGWRVRFATLIPLLHCGDAPAC
jgi:hypothetical protein